MPCNSAKATRGCGDRVAGGIYLETHTSPIGRPIEDFLIDPPRPLDAAALGLSPIGIKLIEIDGVWHVLDWVGEVHYPNVADFVEETRRLGLSRRAPRTLDFSKLTSASRIVLAHPRAYIVQAPRYLEHVDLVCPLALDGHTSRELAVAEYPQRMCAGLWWYDLDHRSDVEPGSLMRRELPSFTYEGHARPAGIEATYHLAAFLSLPIHNLAVIDDHADHDATEAAVKAATAAGIPTWVEES